MARHYVYTFLIIFALLLVAPPAILSADKEENDIAVPAMTDISLVESLMKSRPSLLSQPDTPAVTETEITLFDFNRDRLLNDFDAKQFQAIIESLKGEALTVSELASRFYKAELYQKDSFLMIYDLNGDGAFTYADVQAFVEAAEVLDKNEMKGDELSYQFSEQIHLLQDTK